MVNNTADSGNRYSADEFARFLSSNEGRFELIDGQIYMLASPTVLHQRICGFIYRQTANYLAGKKCEAFIAPLDVFLSDEDGYCENVYQPDVMVVCDEDKIGNRGINGSPDLVIEVSSPSSYRVDHMNKLINYGRFGVREYWIVDPTKGRIFVYSLGAADSFDLAIFTMRDTVAVGIFDGALSIDFSAV